MLFNTIHFAYFLPLVFILYWFVFKSSLTKQNLLLLFASYIFYSCWDWRFLFLLAFSTFLDYYTGLKIHQVEKTRSKKIWLWISIGINLGFLGVFKYFNFFAQSFQTLMLKAGIEVDIVTLNVILPVGISFYTFHGLSYVLDIYFKRIQPEKNFVVYSLFVSFFPLLVAGPIERATHLLPQLKVSRLFDSKNAVDGCRQILWGLVKKVVIADTCAEIVNLIFENPNQYNGSTLVIGAILFAFQIYGDFSGYSDIALGTARLFGIELLRNFSYPYFSRSIAEFWRRWHISLSSWFKDYLYIPLGGSKTGQFRKVMNTFIIFLVSGFWHGANWTFIIWGGLNALFIMPSVFFNTNRNHMEIVAKGKVLPSFRDFASILITFALACIAWVFFRAKSVTQAINYLKGIAEWSLLKIPETSVLSKLPFIAIPLLLFIVAEWSGRERPFAIQNTLLGSAKWMRWSFYYALILIIYFYSGKEQTFIYFQF